MTRLLVSVRDAAEALLAARGGADFIDLKDPAHGALGGLPPPAIAQAVAALRAAGVALPVSATIGDVAMARRATILRRVAAVAACGVDIVKVGIQRGDGARAVLDDLARCATPVAPVFIADAGLDEELVAHALGLGFAAVMADTADKRAGSLLDRVPRSVLAGFVAQARGAGTTVGLAGALRLGDAAALAAIGPDFAGFRSAVCAGSRSGALDARRLQALAEALRAVASAAAGAGATDPQCETGGRSPSSSARMRSIAVR